MHCYCSHTLLKIKNENNEELVGRTYFLSTFKKLNIKGGEETIEALFDAFANKNKQINLPIMLEKYLVLYPDTKLPEDTKIL